MYSTLWQLPSMLIYYCYLMMHLIGCLSSPLQVLYKVYLQSVSSEFQEPPMPTRCYPPLNVNANIRARNTLDGQNNILMTPIMPISYHSIFASFVYRVRDLSSILHSGSATLLLPWRGVSASSLRDLRTGAVAVRVWSSTAICDQQ